MVRGSRKAGRKADRLSGQASVMFGMMMVTFALFFAFVVNVGMLVHAKINLQNAADAAAYAGAAAQARQLNHIGYLNYEMRRQYKKFLFRYYVIGNLARPDADNTSGTRQYLFSDSSSAGLGGPAVCVIFNSKDNICQLTKLQSIKIPAANPLDSLQNTLVEQLRKLEEGRQLNCDATKIINQTVLSLWLMNTDPSLNTVISTLDVSGGSDVVAAAIANAATVSQSLGKGLGIYPRELILRERIKTLAEYVNFAPQTGVTADVAQDLKNSIDPVKRERTILAFESAYKSLGDHTFDNTGSIVLDELLPESMEGADLLRLVPVTTSFDTYYTSFEMVSPGGSADATEKICTQVLAPVTVKMPLPVGFKKATDKLVYYAVRLSADAKLLFNPFGSSLKLKAYAAAQPFGSRVGPLVISEGDFSRESGSNVLTGVCSLNGADCVKKLPDLAMLPGKTWNDFEVQSPYRQALRLNATDAIDAGTLEKTYQIAMAPNKIESGRYLMIEDQHQADIFIRHFDVGNGSIDPTYAFWAPIRSPEKAATDKPEDMLREMLMGVAAGGTQSSIGDSGTAATLLASGLAEGMRTYFSKLREGLGEDGEGFNVVRLKNPFKTLASAGYTPIPLSGELGLSDPLEVKTGWSKTRSNEGWEKGRSGYSVKFVPLRMLQLAESGGGPTPSTDGGGATWDNFPNLIDGDAELDFLKIEH